MTSRKTTYGITIHTGPRGTVYACPFCKQTEMAPRGGVGSGRGHGLRTGGAAFSRMAAHVRASHPERIAPIPNVGRTTRTDDNAAYRRDMIDAGRGHLLR